MPILLNPRHEAFAQSRARGALLEEAYEDAGFVPGLGHASRLGKTPEIVERIAELRIERNESHDISPSAMIAALMRVAASSEALGTEGGIAQARLAILEAQAISEKLSQRRQADRFEVIDDEFALEEHNAKKQALG